MNENSSITLFEQSNIAGVKCIYYIYLLYMYKYRKRKLVNLTRRIVNLWTESSIIHNSRTNIVFEQLSQALSSDDCDCYIKRRVIKQKYNVLYNFITAQKGGLFEILENRIS